MFDNFFKNKKIFITGHTGFKGSWLTIWLKMLGAEVCGFSLEPPTTPNVFELARISEGIHSVHGDIRDLGRLKNEINNFSPEIILHLAAQSLVRKSYINPVETYSTNIMGTVNLLEAVRQTKCVKSVVNITSDKCYENKEWLWGYRESDPMGGYDPYSSSKGCSELITSSYLSSFFSPETFSDHGISIATARVGNVIGGGDFADDRLVPDLIRSFMKKESAQIRFPNAVRPWQHVLEPLSGYLLLAMKLYEKGIDYSGAWNFGPDENSVHSVSSLADKMAALWENDASWTSVQISQPHEAGLLKLDSSKARNLLGWKPRLSFEDAIEWTVTWYKNYAEGTDNLLELMNNQINDYQSGCNWSK